MDEKEVTRAAAPKEEGTELRKPHEMIVMVPRSRRVTLTGRRLYNALLQVSQSRLQAMETMPAADYMFEAPLPALLRTTGSSGEDRTAAKRYLREMRGLEVDWESTAPGDGLKWRGFSMLSEVAIEVRNGENWVSWSYPPTIMSALREPARWARIDLDVLAKLGSYAAVALYEICARYRDNPSGVTSRKPVQWWADALNPAPGGAERREWRKFKNERVKPAIEEINSETDIEIELIEHKLGRAVSEVQFAVRRKRGTPRARALAEGPVDAGLVLRAESLGIREAKLDGLIKEFGEERVREQLDVLERRAVNRKLRGIEHAYAYLRSLLRNGEDEALLGLPPAPAPLDGATVVESRPATEAMAPPSVPVASVPSPAPHAVGATENWLNERIAGLKREIAALDPVQRRGWVDRALQELAARGMLSAVVSRRAAQGDVLHGVLGSVLVRVYAEAVYGPGWDRASGAAA
ncbi:replication initiation protein [Azohydromonas australica]|uniref:replication initiation protein n=1 Tax=Azohydromonas australica TaxID=364039 RepID=UPI000A06C8FF|nr:replication initiation protein [Azohydromonas australica]